MEIESILKQFTRFFVPGLAFMVFCIFLPYIILDGKFPFAKDESIGLVEAGLFSILAGYVLDSIKGYRWTLALRTYNSKKLDVARELSKHTGLISYTNPDQHIALLWKRDENTYNRIFVERAEWVMILETSFALLIGAAAVFAALLYRQHNNHPTHLALFLLPAVLLAMSALSSKNGIDRMTSHDLKLIEAIKALHNCT